MNRQIGSLGASGKRPLPPISAHVVSLSTPLCSALRGLAASGAAGPLNFSFSHPDDGIDPLLAPGIDALIVDIGAGEPDALDFLRRTVALGPNAPVLAVGVEDAALQAEAIASGAEDCLSADTGAPQALGLALRRAIQRRLARDERPAPATADPDKQPRVTLVQETPEAIVILDSAGLVRFANGAARELLGREGDDLIGRPFGLPSDPGEHDLSITRPDGDNRFVEMRIVDTRWGGVPARVAALNDVTVRRKLESTMRAAEAQSHETQRRNQSFFSNVNHDLRTPLTHIIGFSEMMKNERLGPVGTARYKEYASDIYSSGTMLLDMIEDLLGIAEAEMDQIELTDEICNLAQLAEIAVASQRQHAIGEGVAIEVDCPERLAGLRGDAKRIRQGLFRLLAEAVHCAHRGSTIRLILRETADGLTVTLSEERNRAAEQNALPWMTEIDDPFVSAEDSGAPREESLALSLTRKVMEMHGGSLGVVRAADNASGAGMEIALRFPSERVIR
ncbi:histidine kinase dimerization/phospho-acceptor domain-containing protein [uncultured Parvibaculum sp.]|uniref:ATP-binding response regulator n=1 Tax=uncultured Parvibaculum sp. TaxID=291828 RepID=UPI0030EEDEDA